MADVQKQFKKFNDTICLKQYEQNTTLREKRDAVLKKLKERIKALFEEKDELQPTYTNFDQGSYKLGTGVKPLNGDYDIDVGLKFNISKDDKPDAVEVKQWVLDALDGHTKKVEMRRSCVTVFYQSGDEPLYHVDLAIYSDAEANADRKDYFGKGKQNSQPENRIWEEADPDGLVTLLTGRFSGDDWEQFRRCIRYLKRWKDLKFPAEGNAAPVGIGITVAGYNWFHPKMRTVDAFAGKTSPDDMAALIEFVNTMHCNFTSVYKDGETAERLVVNLPVVPYNDVFEKMSNKQMDVLKEKLGKLLETLKEAASEPDPVETCKRFRKVFGDDFPIPDKDDTGDERGPAIITGSGSA
jgi:hypothetical protein